MILIINRLSIFREFFMSKINTSHDNQTDIPSVPAIMKYGVPSPKENVVFKSVTGVCKWILPSILVVSLYNSLKEKKLQFPKTEDLTWVIGGGIASGLMDGITTINKNKEFDNFVQRLEQEKLQAQVKHNQK